MTGYAEGELLPANLVEEMVCSVWKIKPTENTTGDFNKNEVLLVAN